MQSAGFEIWNSTQFPIREDWEEHIKRTVPEELAVRTLQVTPFLEAWELYRRKGFVASPQLDAAMHALATYEEPLFTQRVDEASSLLVKELFEFMGGSMPSTKIPQTISAQAVLDHVVENNPFFSRWLLFQSERPKRTPAEWDEYAAVGLSEEGDIEYARAMRELGQTLQQLIAEGRKMTEYVGIGLMHSHDLSGEDRYWNTVTWLHMAQEDSIR